MSEKLCYVCGKPDIRYHYVEEHFEKEFYMKLEMTPELEQKIKHALMVADRGDEYIKNSPQEIHELKNFPQAIRQSVATMRGEVPHKPNTSYGDVELLDTQVQQIEGFLKRKAKEISERNHKHDSA